MYDDGLTRFEEPVLELKLPSNISSQHAVQFLCARRTRWIFISSDSQLHYSLQSPLPCTRIDTTTLPKSHPEARLNTKTCERKTYGILPTCFDSSSFIAEAEFEQQATKLRSLPTAKAQTSVFTSVVSMSLTKPNFMASFPFGDLAFNLLRLPLARR